MLVVWHINAYTRPQLDRFMLYTSHPMEHALTTQGYTWLSWAFVKTHLVKHFGNTESDTEEHSRKMSSREDQLYLRANPKTWNRIYWGSHMQHRYTVHLGVKGTLIAGRLTEHKNRRETRHNKTPSAQTKKRTTAKISTQREWTVGFTCLKRRSTRKKKLF